MFLVSPSPRDTKGGRSERSERAGNLTSLGLAERYPLTSCVNRHLAPLQTSRRKHDEGRVRRTLSRIHKFRLQQPSSTSPARLGLSGTADPYSVLSAFSSPPAPASCAGRRSWEASLPGPARSGRHHLFLSADQEKRDSCSLQRYRHLGRSGLVTRRHILWGKCWSILGEPKANR